MEGTRFKCRNGGWGGCVPNRIECVDEKYIDDDGTDEHWERLPEIDPKLFRSPKCRIDKLHFRHKRPFRFNIALRFNVRDLGLFGPARFRDDNSAADISIVLGFRHKRNRKQACEAKSWN